MPQSGLYPQAQLQHVDQQGAEREGGGVGPSRTVVTSGAMGAHVWSRPNSRPSSANSQPSQVQLQLALLPKVSTVPTVHGSWVWQTLALQASKIASGRSCYITALKQRDTVF